MFDMFKKLFDSKRTSSQNDEALLTFKLYHSSNVLETRQGVELSEEYENDTDELWGEFKGKLNSDEVLTFKSASLAELMLTLAWEFSIKQYQNNKAKLKPEMDEYIVIFNVFLETICLYFYIIDRTAYNVLFAEKRSFFMNRLMAETFQIVSEMAADKTLEDDIGKNFIDLCNIRQHEYGDIKIESASDDNLKENPFWKYGKKIAILLSGSETDIIINFEAVDKTGATLKNLDLVQLLSEQE